MSVDLANNTTFQRLSLVVMDDSLIKLEHERTQDRVRKIMFDRVESLLIWTVPPWLNICICGIFFALPGFGILLVQEVWSSIVGDFLLALGLGLIGWYVYCGRTTIRAVRGGRLHEIKGIFRPGRVRRFRERLVAGIRRAQEQPQPPATPSPNDAQPARADAVEAPVLAENAGVTTPMQSRG